jgi:UDP-N-acetylmuramoyl-L-alanyl-D-glutamate--2,6-diaminopimelate ligase
VIEKLLRDVTVLQTIGDLAVDPTGLTSDSRAVARGDIFVACRGQNSDGRLFIREAVAAGASAIVCEPPAPTGVGVPLVLVPDGRRALAELSAAFYGQPSQQLGLIGVTGTDGKTTTTHLISAILAEAGYKTGLISTVEVHRGATVERNRTAQTTPEAPFIQRTLAGMRDDGVQIAILEVSSHALETARVHRCVFDCAVFTNLDPEHLDFHGTLRNYRAAKAKLFAQLDTGPAKRWGRLAVVNRDDPSSSVMREATHVPVIEYGLAPGAQLRGDILRANLDGLHLRVRDSAGIYTIRTQLCGVHNAANWLAAIGAARHFGATPLDIQRAAERFGGVPGRLEPVRAGQPFRLFVDFAHTPQGLGATTKLLRDNTRGNLIVLFGQAGRRDLQNRARMAEAVAANANRVVLTSDDPYDEDPPQIVDDLGKVFRDLGWREGTDYWRIVDRSDAIHFAVGLAKPGDCVLLAGRGPEEETVIGGKRIHLVDADVARDALRHYLAA